LHISTYDPESRKTYLEMPILDLKKLAEGLTATDYKAVEPLVQDIDKSLTLRTYLDGFALSNPEKEVWTALRTNKVATGIIRKGAFVNATRWFNYVEAVHPEIQDEIKAAQSREKEKRAAASKAGASYNIGLKDTDKGVVTRFPPEPS
jgi:glutamyl-tRNA synthetase